MLDPTTCEATRSATSSLASADGPSPCGLQDGPMIDLFGQVVVPASRSAPRASSVAATMSATYGLRSSTSSESAVLQRSLASKLPELLAMRGSTMWQQTWKAMHTPLRRLILAHTASARSTCGSGSIGWPTPMAGTPAQKGYNAAGNTDSSRRTVALASWATPATRDWKSNEGSQEFHAARAEQARGKPLSEQAHQLVGAGTGIGVGTDEVHDPERQHDEDQEAQCRTGGDAAGGGVAMYEGQRLLRLSPAGQVLADIVADYTQRTGVQKITVEDTFSMVHISHGQLKPKSPLMRSFTVSVKR